MKSKALLVVFLVTLVAVGSNAWAGSKTHLGVPAEDLVTLINDSDAPFAFGWFRANAFGKKIPFEGVPKGHALVVTDILWGLRGSPNDFMEVRLVLLNPDGESTSVFEKSFFLDDQGEGEILTNFTGGLVVGPGMQIFPLRFAGSGHELILHGYLVDYRLKFERVSEFTDLHR